MEESLISLQVFEALQKSAYAIASEVYKKLMPPNLTLRQFSVLELLYRKGPIYLLDLAEEISESWGNVTPVISNLEKRNLVKRIKDDQNYYVIALTTEGGTLINKLFPAHAKLVEQVMGKLTDAEQENLKRLCARFELTGKDV